MYIQQIVEVVACNSLKNNPLAVVGVGSAVAVSYVTTTPPHYIYYPNLPSVWHNEVQKGGGFADKSLIINYLMKT